MRLICPFCAHDAEESMPTDYFDGRHYEGRTCNWCHETYYEATEVW